MVQRRSQTEGQDKDKPTEHKTCFVMMPISDAAGYEPGHFGRVYNYIIKPACQKAGFDAIRADEVQNTNVIILDILKRILDADMVLCDLSTRNPNVMYELGIRQAFNKPVTLIKDDLTERIFDTGMIRDVPYSASLRVDTIEKAIEEIATSLRNTYEGAGRETNSLIQLLGIESATLPAPEKITPDTHVLLNAIRDLGKRISAIEAPSEFRVQGSTSLPSGAGGLRNMLWAKPIETARPPLESQYLEHNHIQPIEWRTPPRPKEEEG
jgi:hypothetical protein